MKQQIHIPSSSFLKEAQREYSQVSSRLICECLQNSVDAGAKEIKFTFRNGRLTIEDNGSGMNESVLKKGMLTYAGSVKGANAVGFAGAAKKIILFSHESYRIQTRNLIAIGRGINYRLLKIENEEDFEKCIFGTKITIKFARDWPEYEALEAVLRHHLISILSYSNLPTQVTWNGEAIDQAAPSPVELDTETAAIRKMSDKNANRIIVRFNGLYMFHQYSNHAYYYDCKGHSRDALTQNRESFRSDTIYRKGFQEFVNTLANNSRSGIAAQASYQKHKDINVFHHGIEYKGTHLPKKMSKREKSIYSLCKAAGEMVGFELSPRKFGFYSDHSFRGFYADQKLWINSTKEIFQGEDWELQCIETFFHELSHEEGHEHDESFISDFGQRWVRFLKEHSGINPLRARMRQIEKETFND